MGRLKQIAERLALLWCGHAHKLAWPVNGQQRCMICPRIHRVKW